MDNLETLATLGTQYLGGIQTKHTTFNTREIPKIISNTDPN